MQTQTIPADVRDAISNSILGYLHNQTEAVPYRLTKPTRVTMHGSELKGEFIRCLMGHQELPVGTEGWLFISHEYSYSDYRMIDDWSVPAPGATKFLTATYYSWVTLVEIAGQKVLADAFHTVEHNPPVKVGVVNTAVESTGLAAR